MGRPGGLLRYADLDPVSSATERARDASALGSVVEPRVGAVRARRQEMASDEEPGEGRARRPGRPRGDPGDGSKSLSRIENRMAKRADRAALRDALDLIRQQELLENMEMRRARTRQRRWYVLGRAIDELMETDGELRTSVMRLLDQHLRRRDERQLIGLGEMETQSE